MEQTIEATYMCRAIELAKKGEGHTHPNPMVGAVIVKNGRVIGEGYHEKYGELHAERNAIASLKESAEGADLYVTLEPCCHMGKTPPCTEAIIEQKIGRVIIGSRDPNPKVSGKGVEILRKAGITVVEDFMREECDRLNPVFFHYITTKMPYVVMKYAMTADGKIGTKCGKSKWITGEASREYVQELRGKYMGILVGIGTVQADDPMLNVRGSAAEKYPSPIRIVCDSHLQISMESRLVQSAIKYRTIVVCGEKQEAKQNQLQKNGVEVWYCPDEKGHINLQELMRRLGEQRIDSILLEGGGTLNASMMQWGLVQEMQAFVAPKVFGGKMAPTPLDGIGVEEPAEGIQLVLEKVQAFGEDVLLKYRIKRGEKKQCLPES